MGQEEESAVADLVVLESTTAIPSESWVRLEFDERLPSPAGPAGPLTTQAYTVQVEHAFFVKTFDCTARCDPDAHNPLILTDDVHVADFGRAVAIADITTPSAPRAVAKRATPRPLGEYVTDDASYVTVEDAGYDAQPPAHAYAVTVNANLRAVDGQTLGYTWVGTVQNWHQRAFTSFGDGHGVWETGGGAALPFYARNFVNVRQWAAAIAPGELMPTLMSVAATGVAARSRSRALYLASSHRRGRPCRLAGGIPPVGGGAGIAGGATSPRDARPGIARVPPAHRRTADRDREPAERRDLLD